MDIRFLGHACFELSDGDTRVLIDPFLTGNPKAAVSADDVDPTHIFLTHGHADHWGDVEALAKRTGAHCVAIVELANELQGKGVENVSDPNLGGTVEFDGGWVRLVPAWHTSTTPGGTVNTPAGLVVNLGGTTVYSGGMIWVPLNMHEPPEKGDTRENALDYLNALSNIIIGYTRERKPIRAGELKAHGPMAALLPALFTSRSICPCRASVRATRLSISFSLDRGLFSRIGKP